MKNIFISLSLLLISVISAAQNNIAYQDDQVRFTVITDGVIRLEWEAEGRFTVQAAGYEMQLLLAGGSVRVTVDGRSVTLDADDVRCQNGQVLVTGDFLSRTLDANVIYDAGERSLVLFIRDKSLSEAND